MEAFAHWVQTYQAIIAVVLGVGGWIANHQLTLRAQRKNFFIQLTNSARMELTTHLREYEEYLTELSIFPVLIPDIITDKLGTDLTNEIELLRKTIKKYNGKWLNTLEAYQTLFPELRIALSVLIPRNEYIHEIPIKIQGIMLDKTSGDKIKRIKKTEEQAWQDHNYIIDTIGLVQDLLVYIQVKCFAEITNNAIPKQRGSEHGRPKFIIKNGKLEYVEDEEQILDIV